MKLNSSVCAAAVALITLAQSAIAAPANQYPTVDRIEYVHACQRDHSDRPAQEMLYKCSCVIDTIADQLNYDDYVESSTAYYASSIAGERGQVIRTEVHTKHLADMFKSIQAAARKSCFVN